jgi:hypothetical protein
VAAAGKPPRNAGINLTDDGYSDSLAPLAVGMDFVLGRRHLCPGSWPPLAAAGRSPFGPRGFRFRRRYAPLFPSQSTMRTQVPNAMLEFAFESAL